MKRTCVAFAIGFALSLAACDRQGGDAAPAAADEAGFATELRTRLLDARPSEVIEVPAGTFPGST